MATAMQSSVQQSLGTNDTSITALEEAGSVDTDDVFK